tara:strand:- start:2360 stop:3319 length:960 start_codon:yes stop_codon:yes gene_type:complete
MNFDLQAGMVIKCCAGDCRSRNATADALRMEEEIPDEPNEFVRFDCTKCGIVSMHKPCYDKLSDFLLKHVKSGTMNTQEKMKALWDKGRSGKYDMISKCQALRCYHCSNGTLCCVTEGRLPVIYTTGDISSTPQTKKKTRTKKPIFTQTRRSADPDSDNAEENIEDPDLLSYIWNGRNTEKPPVQQVLEQKIADLTCEQEFPDLPLGHLPPPRPIVRAIPTPSIPLPTFCLRAYPTFHCIEIFTANSWKPQFIGHRGKHINGLIMKLRLDGIHISNISVDDKMPRIYVYASNTDDREIACLLIQERLNDIVINPRPKNR